MSQIGQASLAIQRHQVQPDAMGVHELEKRDNHRDAFSQATLDGLFFGLLGVVLIFALLGLLLKSAFDALVEKFSGPPPGATR